MHGIISVMGKHSRKMVEYEKKKNAVPLQVVKKTLKVTQCDVRQLTPYEIAILSAIPSVKKCDYEFVGTLLKMLFENSEEELRNLVLQSKKSTPPNAVVMSDTIRRKIMSYMNLRCAKISDPVDRFNRIQKAYVSSVISKSIFEVKKSLEN